MTRLSAGAMTRRTGAGRAAAAARRRPGDGLTDRAAPLIAISAMTRARHAPVVVATPVRRREVHRRRRSGERRSRLGSRDSTPGCPATRSRSKTQPAPPPPSSSPPIALGLAGVIVVPALGYLFWLTQAERWTRPRGTPASAATRVRELPTPASESEVPTSGGHQHLGRSDVVVEQGCQIAVAGLGSDLVDGGAVCCGHRRVPCT